MKFGEKAGETADVWLKDDCSLKIPGIPSIIFCQNRFDLPVLPIFAHFFQNGKILPFNRRDRFVLSSNANHSINYFNEVCKVKVLYDFS